jgi:CRISPR/Cas system CMR-associated protein Cmr3 (group 5 of RAMP superfamily)
MKKSSQIGLAVIIIALVGTGIGIGVFFVMNPSPTQEEDVVLTISGGGTTGDFTLTMSELKSSKYQQFENQFYARSVDRNATYSGVSIRDILEKESLLTEDAINYTFIAADGYDSAVHAGFFLNITKLMNVGYAECIFAYGGTDFVPEEDGLVRSIINMTIYPELSVGSFWNKNCTQMKIIAEPEPEDVVMTISGNGTTDSLYLTMTQLQSSKYLQFENLFYARSSSKNGTYSGVSIRDILEKESILTGGAVNYTFIAADGYDSADHAGVYLNITKLMNAGYAECIFAYGGTDFVPEDDGPIRSIINMTVQSGINLGPYWNRNCTQMQIIGEPFITIGGSGTTGSLSLTMTQLLSSKYLQYVNQFYARSSSKNGTYSGVSIRDILEKESLLIGGAINYTFIAADGYDSADHAGAYLNITKLMNAGYGECIFAYGGTDFVLEDDGPFRSIVNMTVQTGINLGPYWNRNCTQMQILA